MKRCLVLRLFVAPRWHSSRLGGRARERGLLFAQRHRGRAGDSFLTDVMMVSSTCQDTIYAEFRLRNREAILAYQKAMIAHFHGAPGVRPVEHR